MITAVWGNSSPSTRRQFSRPSAPVISDASTWLTKSQSAAPSISRVTPLFMGEGLKAMRIPFSRAFSMI